MGPTLLRKTILEGMDNDIIQFLFDVIIIECPYIVCGFVITYTMKISVKLTRGQMITFHWFLWMKLLGISQSRRRWADVLEISQIL